MYDVLNFAVLWILAALAILGMNRYENRNSRRSR